MGVLFTHSLTHLSNNLIVLTLYVLLSIFLLTYSNDARGQAFCGTAGGMNQVGVLPSGACFTDNPGPYFIKVYVHVIRLDDGNGGFSGGQLDEDINTAFDILDEDFTPHNIFFVRSCEVIDIPVSGTEYNNPELFCSLWANTTYEYGDGISLFLGPPISYLPPSDPFVAIANGIPCNKLWLGGNLPLGGGNVVPTRVISHEFGHVLGLYHTEHGTLAESSLVCNTLGFDPNECCELVEDYNSTDPTSTGCSCGDYVPDTPADIGTDLTDSSIDCIWITPDLPNLPGGNYCYHLNGTIYEDENNDPYAPETTNIMSSTGSALECRSGFTVGQGRRMRYLIENETILQVTNVSPVISNPQIIGTVNWTTSNMPNGGDFLIEGNLTIKGGGTLIIESGVIAHFGEDNKVIVEPGGKLGLSGTLTSNTCGTSWQGVEVWGVNGISSQVPSISIPFPPVPPPMGASFSQGTLYGLAGGLIENAVIAVKLYRSTSIFGTNGPVNPGGVIWCDGTAFKNSVKGVVFGPFQNFGSFNRRLPYFGRLFNCTFEVNDNYPHKAPFHSFVHMSGVNGVWISGSDFHNNITPSFPFTSNALKYGYGIFANGAGFVLENNSTFNSLGYGVYVGASGSQYPFTTQSCTFNQCITGIRNREVSGATILYNTFNMGDTPNWYTGDQVGISFEDDITSFTCQENNFINTVGNSYDFLIGIICNNTGDFSKAIRKNDFVGLDIGNLSNGTNGGGLPGFERGLNYLCNTNSNISGSTDFDVADGQIRPIQGLPNTNSSSGYDATGNTFSYTGTDFDNMGGGIEYFYDPNGSNEVPLTLVGNITLSQALPNTCLTELFERPPLDAQLVNQLKDFYHDTKNAHTQLEIIYQSNPTEAIADTLSLYRLQMDETAYLITQHIINDTISPYEPDSLYAWISNLESYEGDLWLAREHLSSGNLATATQVFNNIPSKYSLSAAQLADLNNYAAIANLIDTLSAYNLDTTTLSAISFYDNVGGHAEGWAQNILTWYGEHYPIEYVISQGGQQLIRNNQIGFQQNAMQDYRLSVFPNPAQNEVNFSFTGNIPEEGCSLVVRDVHGRATSQFVIDHFNSSVSWDSSRHPSGIYYYQLLSNGKSLETGKIVLNK